MHLSISNSEPGSRLCWSAKIGWRQVFILLGFVAAFFFADRCLAHGLKSVLLRSQFRYSKLYQGGNESGLLIFGNSRGVNGFFAPDLSKHLSLPVLNMSYNGLSMGMTELLLRDYLERNPKPRLVIIEVTNLQNEGLNGDVLKLYSACSDRLAEASRKLHRREEFTFNYVAASHRFSGEFFLRVMYYFVRSDQDWINRYRIDPDFAKSFRPSEEMQSGWSAEIPADRMAALRRIIELAKSHGIELRLVVTPYLPNYVKNLDGFKEWLAQVEAASGLPVVDWSLVLSDAQHFADPLHMNLDGFRTFLPIIIGDLRDWIGSGKSSSPARE